MPSLIEIQDELIEAINRSAWRWNIGSHIHGHSAFGFGHYYRTRRGAIRRAKAKLAKLGLTTEGVDVSVKDAIDVAELHLRAVE